jgi:hypothetical protein
MRKQRQNRPQRALRSRRAARQVYDQRLSQRPANRTAQRSKRRMPQSISAHLFRQSVDQPFTDQPRGLRSHVPRSQPGTPRSHNQVRALCVPSQRYSDQIQLIRKRLCRHQARTSGLQQLADSRPGQIDLLSPRTAVTDRQHNGANIGRKPLGHALSLRVLPFGFIKLRHQPLLHHKPPQK